MTLYFANPFCLNQQAFDVSKNVLLHLLAIIGLIFNFIINKIISSHIVLNIPLFLFYHRRTAVR